MKKILYIANARVPTEKAHGIQIMKMCEEFSNLGHSVTLVVPWRFNPIKEDPFTYYGVRNNFKIKKIPSIDLVMFGKLGFLIQTFSFAECVSWYALFKKTDIIYSRDEVPAFYLALFKSNVYWEAHTSKYNFFIRKMLNRLKGLVVISNGLREFYEKKGVSSDKIHVAPDGVDLEAFTVSLSKENCRKKLDLPLDKKIVMYAGHLYKWKGVHVLARAVSFLEKNALAVFVGGTEKDIKEFKKIYGSYKNILIIGKKPYEEIPFYLKAADVLVLPNSSESDISRLYTSPMKLFEYMASSIPIVASDLPSIREVLNKDNSILVESDNPEKLAQGIRMLISDTDLSNKLAVQAWEDVKKYTWSARVNNLIKYMLKQWCIGCNLVMSHFEQLSSYIPNLIERNILDIGSGRGEFLIGVAKAGGTAVGVEINNIYIKTSNKNARKEGVSIKVVESQGEKLPFSDSSFGFVNASELIEHVEDPSKVFSEVYRVLELGGFSYVSVPNRFGIKDPHFKLYFVNWLPRSLTNIYIKIFGKHKDYEDSVSGIQRLTEMHYHTFFSAEVFFKGLGFNVEDIRENRIKSEYGRLFKLPFLILYYLLRPWYFDTFHIVLTKTKHNF